MAAYFADIGTKRKQGICGSNAAAFLDLSFPLPDLVIVFSCQYGHALSYAISGKAYRSIQKDIE